MYYQYKLLRTVKDRKSDGGKKYYQDGVNVEGLLAGFITKEIYDSLTKCSQGKVRIITMNGDYPNKKPVKNQTESESTPQPKTEEKEDSKPEDKKSLAETLKSEYNRIFGKDPHHLKNIETIKEEIENAKSKTSTNK